MAQEKDDTGKWAVATLDDIHMRSPTSVKVALDTIRRAKNMTLGEVLQMEMNLATAFIVWFRQLCQNFYLFFTQNGASQDFFIGVRALFIDKLKGQRPSWNPSTLAEVSDDKISKDYFDADSPLAAKGPQLSLKPETGPVRRDYALPSEDEIEALVLGSHATSSGTAQTLDTLLARLRQLRGDKHGLREKVTEVVSRRCKVSQDSDSQGYLQWKH
jgi:3-hydroxyisobutyryl-CoA hydrolase